ncbi:MAG: hypothetical protein WCE94_02395 [Candidatus Methanoperedens sp.]
MTELTSETLTIVEYTELRSELSEIQKIPERWGTIMLPLSAGILAVSVNSLKDLPDIGVIILVFLSIATIGIWRLIGYNSMWKAKKIADDLDSLQERIKIKGLLGWERYRHPYSFLGGFVSQRALLDLFALLYIATGIVIIFVKLTRF